jgi:hypothetical protein
MERPLSLLIVVFACSAFTACTSLHTVLDAQSASASAALPALTSTDQLTITTRDGTQTQIALTRTAPEFIEGTQDDGKPLHFALPEVVKIERREFDGVKTTFLAILISVGVYAILRAAAQASLAGSL